MPFGIITEILLEQLIMCTINERVKQTFRKSIDRLLEHEVLHLISIWPDFNVKLCVLRPVLPLSTMHYGLVAEKRNKLYNICEPNSLQMLMDNNE